ncbi:MAG: helix-hairpin-helix domain-containing protein, partial [Spirochaetia bacterium]
WKLPDTCPSCSSRLAKQGAHHFCVNPSCPDQVRGRLNFFVGRGQMDIEGLGPETIDALLKNDLIHDIDDIYSFDPARLIELPGFGEKKVAGIREGIDKSKKLPFHVVFPSLGIPEIGQKVTELLINAGYSDIDSLLKLAEAEDPAPLLEIHGIGERTAEVLLSELRRPEVQRRIKRLRAAGLSFAEKKTKALSSLPRIFAGQTWCVTGSFQRFKPREIAMEEVKKRGGRVTDSVTSKTTHLLAGESAGSKLEKAKKLGISIVSEDEFLQRLEKP